MAAPRMYPRSHSEAWYELMRRLELLVKVEAEVSVKTVLSEMHQLEADIPDPR